MYSIDSDNLLELDVMRVASAAHSQLLRHTKLFTMDNPTRSETTRRKAIEAAFALLTREGVKGLTFDSLAQESGISKGGLMHQFRTKNGVLKALLDFQRQDFDRIARNHLASDGASKTEQILSMQIAMYRAASNQSHSVARAILAALVENPELLTESRESEIAKMKKLQDDAVDPELALVRYFAASGIAFNVLLGLSPISKAARERLFARLMDDNSWKRESQQEQPRKRSSR